MGIFFEQVEYINRDCIQRCITFDGQRVYLQPNYDEEGNFLKDVHNFAPKLCIPYAFNQNVVMGSEDTHDPSAFDSYVVPLIYKVKKLKKGEAAPKKAEKELRYDISFLPSSKNESKTRVPLDQYLDDPSLKVLDGRGKFRAAEARIADHRITGIANQDLRQGGDV